VAVAVAVVGSGFVRVTFFFKKKTKNKKNGICPKTMSPLNLTQKTPFSDPKPPIFISKNPSKMPQNPSKTPLFNSVRDVAEQRALGFFTFANSESVSGEKKKKKNAVFLEFYL
jgi:hypothetical protein